MYDRFGRNTSRDVQRARRTKWGPGHRTLNIFAGKKFPVTKGKDLSAEIKKLGGIPRC